MYKSKYLKYKNKYIQLKNQIGGNPPLIIPCEITNITNLIFMNTNFIGIGISKKISDYLSHMKINIINSDRAQFQQDPVILLKDKDNKDYAIEIRPGEFQLDGFQVKQIKYNNGNDYGGNFISSPSNKVYFFENIKQELGMFLQNHALLTLLPLKCSFRFNGERHIDECITFMPYGETYKIWIYKIRNIEFSESLKSRLAATCDQQKLQEISKKLVEIKETLKTRPSTQNNQTVLNIEYILSGQTEKLLSILEDRNFTKRLSEEDVNCIRSIIPNSNQMFNKDSIRQILETERIANLNAISMAEFGQSYESVRGVFVEFPIDLEIDEHQNCKITNIPIFNRLWIESQEACLCLFSIDENIDPDVNQILQSELPKIKSILNHQKPVYFDFINTIGFNQGHGVGGNLHCLIKNKY